MRRTIILVLLWILFVTCYIAWGEEFYTPNQVVASVICAEGVGEGEIGLYGIANVISNRSKKYNKTPYEIVTQPNQFYGYTSKNREELYKQGKEYCDYLAENIFELNDITNGALYFRTAEENKQSWHNLFCIKIKHHIFYK